MNYLFFDTETTGVPPRPLPSVDQHELWPRIVQIHWELRDEEGRAVEEPASYILRPDGFVIPPDSIAVHGITQEMAEKHGVSRAEVLSKFADKIRQSLPVAHNFDFDAPIVQTELLRLGIHMPITTFRHICTMRQTTDLCALPSPNQPGRFKPPRLNELYRFVFGRDMTGAHDAGNDVRAMVECFYELRRRGIKFEPVQRAPRQ